MKRNNHYETTNEYNAEAYQIDGWHGIAWHILGWEIEPDEDTEWSGYENRTGRLIAVMVGDDRQFPVDPDEIHPLNDDDYCCVCGQIGCPHNA